VGEGLGVGEGWGSPLATSKRQELSAKPSMIKQIPRRKALPQFLKITRFL
jgi:hypothetical protein